MSKPKILRAIQRQCAECMGNHPHYVRGCASTACPLFPYRLGDDPDITKKPVSAERRAELSAQLSRGRATRAIARSGVETMKGL